MTFFEVKNLTFGYASGNGSVIRDFSLQMEQGEVVGLLGNSGCGKSTLLRLIAGLESPKSGRIQIDGKVLVDQGQFVEPEQRGIGMIFQDYALFPHLTVEQNILFGLHRLSKAERLVRLKEMLALVQLEGYGKRYPHELSGGQQQRVAFARALAPRPAILLMDEPFSNLDAELKTKIRDDLKRMLRAAKMTSILVTHDKADAETICDRIIRMTR
ncbi:ABC transporter ATP-binding protein [Brevibacillus sp. HB1.2]|uniref:ABC transporter ATP-binding protein n=1 Tax=Brevibacillus TaxID=55080 RepID=UPI00037FB606|nr:MULTISPECIES: ABC transporter ATP-binding protein [unclassified Brevibacillus]ATF11458.1 ABC transporter ATP-binding protein [Brevibacillus brevis X23]NRR23582.1 ABC transporter ATP-binding protein [Brevibacillus sp. MS2.2]NRS17316.1 ABC transporter ATP-binding protein [Brevibacillus sp. HB1.4B]NTU21014.1 ABC transporter ATP-binding protein [Brevibacillus sp. HB1.2]NTU30897.1 ABC transporter ATP-binding protein [Brevibacillus sp. HB1.1]